MLQSFHTILIPLDFTINTEVAIAKALEMDDLGLQVIHLLHIETAGSATGTSGQDVKKKLEQWKTSIEEFMPSVQVHVWIERADSVHNCIRAFALQVKASLVVIGKRAMHNWVPIFDTVSSTRLAESTGIPVLTVKPGSMRGKVKTVVVPITDDFPRSKMAAIELLCRKGRLNIHLIAFGTDRAFKGSIAADSLLQIYQWLRTTTRCPVEYTLLPGYNKARAILSYAEKVSADMLLVYPDSETKIGWWNRHISDVLPASSKMRVLAVQPTHSSV
jgi:nucleotide-binding universal stress UspA family protein